METIKRFITSSFMDIVIRVVVIISIVGMVVLTGQVSSTSKCLQQYIQIQAKYNETARLAASEDRKVIDDLVTEITLAKSAKDTVAALNEYLDKRAANDKLRSKNPPPPSNNVCS